MRFRTLAALVAVAILIFAAAYGTAFVRRGFSARAKPSSAEELVANAARSLALPSTYRELHNPVAASPQNLQAGMAHYSDHCATCHSNNGDGETLLGRGLYPKPPDLRSPRTQQQSDGQLYYTIENGIGLSGMPAFGTEHSAGDDVETWHLVLFIRHLPQITADELDHMKEMNPTTEADRAEEQQEKEFLNGSDTPPANPAPEHHH